MGFEDEMSQFDDAWAEDAEKPRGGVMLEDGPHQVIITESRVEEQDQDYTWVIKFVNKAGSIRKWSNLGHEVGRSIAASDSRMMGYEGNASGFKAWVESEGPIHLVCEIRVKTTPGTERDFKNVYVNKVLGVGNIEDFTLAEGEVATAAGTKAVDDDDIPFAPTMMTSGGWGI